MHRWITARGTASRQSAETGFVLPLAITTSVVLLLGSASLHTLALHGRWRERQQWQSITQRDQLRSAAMMFLDQASDPGQRCVLAWPSSHWSGLALQCPDADLDRLRQGQLDGESWKLLQWQLTPTGSNPDAGVGQQRLGGCGALAPPWRGISLGGRLGFDAFPRCC